MKTAEERKTLFIADFKALLRSHGAEFEVTDNGASFGMQSGVALVSMDSIYDDKHNLTAEFNEFELPTYI